MSNEKDHTEMRLITAALIGAAVLLRDVDNEMENEEIIDLSFDLSELFVAEAVKRGLIKDE